MSYTPHTWVDGETINAAKMNNIEAGIGEAAQSGSSTNIAVVTINNDFSELGQSEYTVNGIHCDYYIVGTNYCILLSSYDAFFNVVNNTITIPIISGSVAINNIYAQLEFGSDSGFANGNVTAASGNAEISSITTGNGTVDALIITGNCTISIAWYWND